MAVARKKPEDSGGPIIGEWMVTFSDCMTLLLCFFVLLLSFSSFEEVALDKFSGIFPCMIYKSIFDNPRIIPDSVVPPPKIPIDRTEEGSEFPTRNPPQSIKNPKPHSDIDETAAHTDAKTVRIPSSKLFYGRGSRLKTEGKRLLDVIAPFLDLIPSQVVISETSARGAAGYAATLSGERAYSVLRYFTETKRLDPERFNISMTGFAIQPGLDIEPALEIVMLSRSLYR